MEPSLRCVLYVDVVGSPSIPLSYVWHDKLTYADLLSITLVQELLIYCDSPYIYESIDGLVTEVEDFDSLVEKPDGKTSV